MAEDTLIPCGTVWLVGAGPGDPDLLTRKAEKLIRAASVVFYDALVGPGVLDLVPDHIRLMPVGKRSGRHSKDQGTINDLLVQAALDGERVVRLKGGDPSIFGRSAEEMASLAGYGIPVHICPGVTTARALDASEGITLTLLGKARKLQFMKAHARAGEKLDLDWRALADNDATLAIYMGRATAPEITQNLISHGLPKETPVLVAVSVSLPEERILRTRLDLLPLVARALSENDPTLIIVGEAASAYGKASQTAARQEAATATPCLQAPSAR